MKKIFLFLILLPFIVDAKVYYVSPSGRDSNPGTLSAPFATWQKLGRVLATGDTGYIRGGKYILPDTSTDFRIYFHDFSGTANNVIKVWAYPGENPVLDFNNITQPTNSTAFMVINCNYIHFKGLRLTGLAQNAAGNEIGGWTFFDCNNIIIESCEIDHFGGYAFNTSKGCSNHTYINCDAHHNANPYSPRDSYGDADGFDCTSGNVSYIGCRAWWNSDDGFDCFNNDSLVSYEDCRSFYNGYVPGTKNSAGNGMGFKWGRTRSDLSTTVLRKYSNCLAFQNRDFGFDQNAARCIAEFYNNTSYNNGTGAWATGYSLKPRVASVFKNNISYNDSIIFSDPAELVEDHNSWNGLTITKDDFISLNSTGIDGSRQSDGSLPNLNFLRPQIRSKLSQMGYTFIPSINQTQKKRTDFFLLIILFIIPIAAFLTWFYFGRGKLSYRYNKKPERS